MGQQLFLEIMRAVLVATIRVEKAAGRRITQPHRHVQGTDGQVLFHPVADNPPDHATTEQIDDDRQIEPAFGCPDMADISRPFPVGPVSREVAIQKVGHNIRLGLAVSGDLVATGTHGPDSVVLHQSANTTFPDIRRNRPFEAAL